MTCKHDVPRFTFRLPPRCSQCLDEEAEQRGYARGVTEAAAVVDRIGRDWFDFGDAAKSYGAQYLVEKIRALVPHE